MSLSKVELKNKLKKMGIKTEGNYIRTKDLEKFIKADSFMKPEIYQGEAYEVDGSGGITVVPFDLVGDLGLVVGESMDEDDESFKLAAAALKDFVEGEIWRIELSEGWLARLSAPGYMDSTEWSIYDSKQEAEEELKIMYGDDTEES